MNKCFNSGFESHGVFNLTPSECFELCRTGETILVDVREEYMNSFRMFKVEKLIYLPYSQIEDLYDQLPVDQPLIFADAVGLKSREAVLFMKAHKYDNVANMAGGMADWERDGLPVTTDLKARLSGSCMCQLKPRESKK